jgi:hypothetical protein
MALGVSDDGHGADQQQLAQITISLLGDPAKAFLGRSFWRGTSPIHSQASP